MTKQFRAPSASVAAVNVSSAHLRLATSTVIRCALFAWAQSSGLRLPECADCVRVVSMRGRGVTSSTRLFVALPESWPIYIDAYGGAEDFGVYARAALAQWAALTPAQWETAAAEFVAVTMRQPGTVAA